MSPLADARVRAYRPDPKGRIEARRAVAGYYASKRIRVPLDDIVLTASTSEAYAHLFRLLCAPGERVAVPQPGYPLFASLAELSDIGTDGYDPEDPAGTLAPGAKAVVAVHPNNPTGRYVSPRSRSQLIEHCRARQAALIADEVFLDFNHGRGSARSFAGQREVLTFTLSGISKLLGLPQMKLAWIVVSGPADEKREALRRLEIIADTFLSVGAPVQTALGPWMRARSRIASEIRERVRANAREAAWRLGAAAAEAGWYAVVPLRGPESAEAVALRMLDRHKVAVHPGYFYDYPADDRIVLSLLSRPVRFREGLQRLALDLTPRI